MYHNNNSNSPTGLGDWIMKAKFVYWTPKINVLSIECEECENSFDTPMNRWKIKCPWCGAVGDMHTIRNELAAKDVKLCGGGLH